MDPGRRLRAHQRSGRDRPRRRLRRAARPATPAPKEVALILLLFAGTGGAAAPTLDGRHLSVHGGTLDVALPPTVTAGHLAIHGGTVTIVLPPTLDTGHLAVHGGTVAIGVPAISVTFAPAIAAPSVPGPLFVQEGVVAGALVATLYRRSDLTTPVGTFTLAKNHRWQEQLSEPGAGSLVVRNNDPLLDDVIAATATGSCVIRFDLHGWAAFTWLVRDIDRKTIDGAEEAGQLTTLAGPGTLAVLEEALVYPSRGVDQWPIEEDRLFSWPSVDYNDGAWSPATVIAADIAAAQAGYAALGSPSSAANFPDPTAATIWSVEGSLQDAPPGDVYFRGVVTATTNGEHGVYVLLDNWGAVYVDGQLVLELTGKEAFYEAAIAQVYMTAGPHTIAVLGTNWANNDTGANPGALAICVYRLDDVGNPMTLIGHTGADWKVLGYPPQPPGMTPGEVIRHCHTEAQARGALLDVTLAFDDDTDSAGQPWDETGDISTKVGTDLLTFARELSATYIDLWMEPGSLRLCAWRQGTRGTQRAITLHPPTDPTDPTSGNLTALTHRRQA